MQKSIDAAKVIAYKTGASLTMLHSYQANLGEIAVPGMGSLPSVYQDQEEADHQALNHYVTLAQQEGYQADSIWELGTPQAAILKQVSAIKADLIVLGRTGRGGYLDKLIGSSATSVAMGAPCPVLVIPPQANIAAFTQVVYATQLEYEEIVRYGR